MKFILVLLVIAGALLALVLGVWAIHHVTLGISHWWHGDKPADNEEKGEGSPGQAATQGTAARHNAVEQLPDRFTPCKIHIERITDLYTDGDPVWVLPARWPKKKAILYSGHGHLVIEGDDIHVGDWEFWSDDPNKVALVRVFGK
jgi:hypothetical protein